VLQVGGGFQSTMQIAIVRGRGLTDADDTVGAVPVVVVSEAFATAAFRGAEALGRQVRFLGDSEKIRPLAFQIVGVVRDVAVADLRPEHRRMVYLPFGYNAWGRIRNVVYEVRTAGDPMAYANTLRGIVHDANPRMPVERLRTQHGLIDRTISRQILLARLCSWFALLALVIAVVGLYGTVLYDVTRRTAEIGVRIALGATAGRVLWMVLGDVTRVTAGGLAIGIPAALALTRLADSLLVGVTHRDPMTVIGAAIVLAVAALLAGFVPAQNPKLTILVSIDEPPAGGPHFGGLVAAPVFSSIAQEALQQLQIPPIAGTSSCPQSPPG